MGQPVAVVEKPSTTPGVVRFESNRTLSGQGHERFASAGDAVGPRPAAELARRLFATGKVDAVHVYANMITVDLAEGCDADGLVEVVRDLHQYWKPGMQPPAFAEEEEPPAEPAEPAEPAGPADAVAGGELSEAAKRLPAALLERSRLARERWKAKQG